MSLPFGMIFRPAFFIDIFCTDPLVRELSIEIDLFLPIEPFVCDGDQSSLPAIRHVPNPQKLIGFKE